MMEFHVHRQILRALKEMQQNMSVGTQRKEMRPISEHLAVLGQIREACRSAFSPQGQRRCMELLDRLIDAVERLGRKRVPGRKQRDDCVRRMGELHAQLSSEKQEVKKAMVFLPYSAVMWDSMESIWKAARRDAVHCSSYVIPIPYCEKNPDGSPGAWHCDIGRFPAEVPVSRWEDWNLEELHPDVIVIHYPYEEGNAVVSVDGRFYPRNLRNCTDRLVHVPYFVFRDADMKKETIVKGRVAELARVPGVEWADMTAVQSEAVRQAYLSVLEERHGREYWESRILALGSPKIDRVRSTTRENTPLPEEWKRIIGGRKVVLYNTSISVQLDDSDVYLGKFRDTMEAFRRNDKVAFWWRPHPLLMATIRAMCPEILGDYQQIVETYKKEGWGIYDDTEDMYRAIAWSDAFYGDGSSVAILYGMTGKPVLAQNYTVRCKRNMGGGSDG